MAKKKKGYRRKRTHYVSLSEVAGFLGLVDNWYNLANTPLPRGVNNVANEVRGQVRAVVGPNRIINSLGCAGAGYAGRKVGQKFFPNIKVSLGGFGLRP